MLLLAAPMLGLGLAVAARDPLPRTVLTVEPSPAETIAAEELASWLTNASGTPFAVKTHSNAGGSHPLSAWRVIIYHPH